MTGKRDGTGLPVSPLAISVEDVIDHVPRLGRYRKGTCILVPYQEETSFLLKHVSVLLIKNRCLNCLHLRLDKGCGIGPDCCKICLVPGDDGRGWSNIETLPPAAISFLARAFTLLEQELPGFVQEQVPATFLSSQQCEKFVAIKPVATRMLVDLATQLDHATGHLPPGELPRFQADIDKEREELLDRLAVLA